MENEQTNESEKTVTPMIDEAIKAAERLEKANSERKLLIEREEALEARRRLGGETGASPVEKKEETPLEYKNRILKGIM